MRPADRDQVLAVVAAGGPRLWRGRLADRDARQLIAEADHRGRQVVVEAPVHIVHRAAGEHRRVSRAHRRRRSRA